MQGIFLGSLMMKQTLKQQDHMSHVSKRNKNVQFSTIFNIAFNAKKDII